MIRITNRIFIDETELQENFIRASGPGGQNVNKVSSAVQLRFDAANSPGLDEETRARLATLAGRRMTRDGVIVITAQSHRSQEMNRQEAVERLIDLIREAAHRLPPRRATKPSYGSKLRRLDGKSQRGKIKEGRRPVTTGD